MVLSKTKPRNTDQLPFPVSTIETIDSAMYHFLDEVLNISAVTPNGFKKVPVIWASAERLFQSKRDSTFRDQDGTLNFPLITVERRNVVKDPSRKGSVVANIPPIDKIRGGSIAVSRRLNHSKTGNFVNADAKRKTGQLNFPDASRKAVFQTITIPLPVYVIVEYEITMRAEYQQQMNQIMTPFITRPGGINYLILEHGRLRYEAFVSSDYSHSNNISDFSNEERKFETKLNIEVLGWLTGEDVNREQPNFSIRENIVEIKIPRERVVFADDLEQETGRLYGLEGLGIGTDMPFFDKVATYSRGGGADSSSSGGSGGGGGSSNPAGGVAVTSLNYKTSQVPSESPDGSRKDFTIPEDFILGSLMVFRDGVLMARGGVDPDYTLSGRVVTFDEALDAEETVSFSYVSQ